MTDEMFGSPDSLLGSKCKYTWSQPKVVAMIHFSTKFCVLVVGDMYNIVPCETAPPYVLSGAYERRNRKGACNSGSIQIQITSVLEVRNVCHAV